VIKTKSAIYSVNNVIDWTHGTNSYEYLSYEENNKFVVYWRKILSIDKNCSRIVTLVINANRYEMIIGNETKLLKQCVGEYDVPKYKCYKCDSYDNTFQVITNSITLMLSLGLTSIRFSLWLIKDTPRKADKLTTPEKDNHGSESIYVELINKGILT